MCSRCQWGPLQEGYFWNGILLKEIVFVVDPGMTFRGEGPGRDETQRALPGLYVRTDEDDEPDHPDFNNHFREIGSIRDGFELPAVLEAYRHLKISFTIFRRRTTVLQR